MLKELETDKERAEKVASRKWRNNKIRQEILEKRRLPKRGDPSNEEIETEIAKVVTNEERLGSKVKRFENKFKREIREMLEGHAKQNLAIYANILEHRKIKLLREKLKRLKAAEEAKRIGLTQKDLFS